MNRIETFASKRLAACFLLPLSTAAFISSPVSALEYGHSGPLTDSGPITIQGEENTVIENLRITNPNGPCIYIDSAANILIRNSEIGPCADGGIRATSVSGLKIQNNTIRDNALGIYVLLGTQIEISQNDMVNTGRNLVQFDKVSGPNNSFSHNRGSHTRGNPVTEDLISMYKSSGTAASPIKITHNRIRNGGSSATGSGIMLGDVGGAHQLAAYNTLVDPGQVGIGVASGTNIRVIGNRVYQSALPHSNVGLYVWNQYSTTCASIEVSENQVDWARANGASYPWWDGGGCGSVARSGNNFTANLSTDIFNDDYKGPEICQ